MLEDLKGGADFAALAIEQSIDPTGRDGGYLGRSIRPRSARSCATRCRAVASGELTGVVRIPSGYAIVEVLPDTQEIQASGQQSRPPPGRDRHRRGADSLNVGGLNEADAVFLGVSETGRVEPGPARDVPGPDRIAPGHSRAAGTESQPTAARPGRVAARRDARASMRGRRSTPISARWTRRSTAGRSRKQIADERRSRRRRDDAGDARPRLPSQVGNGQRRVSAHPATSVCFRRITAAAVPRQPRASEKAVAVFPRSSSNAKPDDLEVRWQLNLAYMTLGRYPDGVPEQYLIPLSAFASKDDIGRFVDVAAQSRR